LAAVGEGLLIIELVFFDQIGPVLLTSGLTLLILFDFLSKLAQFFALLFKDLLAVAWIGFSAEESLPLNFSLHEHLLQALNLCFLFGHLSGQFSSQKLIELLFLHLASLLKCVILLLQVTAERL
jgi:hypothetical protein